ncbi:hypothetical protein DBR32_07840 [Taibaiella sp. KBW10]|uniref:DUF502 domain-containing protein n=1 Tax=Taibaiella sp. KBW10 TaxID=2153357 RepID=UPI000F5AF628|nr:DUF502 domain-containing protein [Taibaiella sp. KBW10]RQO30636.1 hypothetical protein DBR32_07840 [Taibaiella sp. KBW10]
MSEPNKNIGKYLLKAFLQGLVILGPISVTVAVIWYVFTSIDNLIPSLSQEMPGLVFVLIIVVTILIGILGTRFFVGRFLVDLFSHIMENTPGIKFIYTAIKEVMVSFVGDKKKFNNPVWVKTQSDPEIWRIGFLTQPDMNFVALEDKVSVYLPHSYAISGWVIITDAGNIKTVQGMNAAEAMKFAVSGGVTGGLSEPKSKEETI